jgi:hypothetical protein
VRLIREGPADALTFSGVSGDPLADGDGDGDALADGDGDGDALADGDGDGDALADGDGDGDALADGERPDAPKATISTTLDTDDTIHRDLGANSHPLQTQQPLASR